MITAVRLVNSFNSSSSGRVEVLYKGVWGTICGDSWDLQDAAVVCRQLGFEGALAAFRASEFGPRIGQIWLDEVQCGGDESSISECVHRGWGDHDCSYYYTAGVLCRPRSKTMRHLQSRPFKVKNALYLALECSLEVLFLELDSIVLNQS